MSPLTRVTVPSLVRVKAGALSRVGIYLARCQFSRVVVLSSAGLSSDLLEQLHEGLRGSQIEVWSAAEIAEGSFERASELFSSLPRSVTAVVGVGGGKALDVAKYVAFLAQRPYVAVPTALSNDGFCSPQSSLTLQGRRRSLPAAMPFGVIVDTHVCLAAPRPLTLAGVGDLAAKATAIHDWKLAFHAVGEPLNDFAVLLSVEAVQAFISRPTLDEEGLRTLGNSLLLSGIAMEICGSSRPASGSEHLISHALDALSTRPRLHGLQVGVATYLMSLVQQQRSEAIAQLFAATGFWQAIIDDPFSAAEWLAAVRQAPQVKEGFYTVLSAGDALPIVARALREDPWLRPCFRD